MNDANTLAQPRIDYFPSDWLPQAWTHAVWGACFTCERCSPHSYAEFAIVASIPANPDNINCAAQRGAVQPRTRREI